MRRSRGALSVTYPLWADAPVVPPCSLLSAHANVNVVGSLRGARKPHAAPCARSVNSRRRDVPSCDAWMTRPERSAQRWLLLCCLPCLLRLRASPARLRCLLKVAAASTPPRHRPKSGVGARGTHRAEHQAARDGDRRLRHQQRPRRTRWLTTTHPLATCRTACAEFMCVQLTTCLSTTCRSRHVHRP